MINPDFKRSGLPFYKFCEKTAPASLIKIKDTSLEGCLYCDNLISIEYDMNCLKISIIWWTYRLNKESYKMRKHYWDSSYEMLEQRKQQLDYLKEELIRLKGIYNLDCYIKSSSNQSNDSTFSI